jgi:dTDP-4-dehydrorhamnose reductase
VFRVKALIFGGTGQVGGALQLTAPDWAEIVALERADCDIGDPNSIAAAMSNHTPVLVINAAAYTAVDAAEHDVETAHRINGIAPGLLAEAAVRGGAGLIHISTDFVFDGLKSSPYLPTDPAAPLSVYGCSKWAGEQAVRAALPGALIIRTSWVYNAGGQNFVNTMLRLMAERDEVRVVSDQVGTPTHAGGLARSIWALAGLGATETYHVTDSGVASWYDFAVAIQEEALDYGLLQKAIPIIPIATADYPTPAKRPAYSILDKGATNELLGPAAHWRVPLRAMIKEKANG